MGTAGSSPSERLGPDRELAETLVTANLILANESVLDGFGHVSARSLEDPKRFLLARSMAPGLVTTEDVLRFDLDAEEIDGDERRPYLERFIHSEIYRVRADVMAVVHSHSPAIVPFSVVETPLRATYHMAGFLMDGAPVYEIRDDAGGDSNMLISSPRLGRSLARALGAQTLVLMRGHGCTVAGGSVEQAVFHAVYAEQNARIQAAAMQLGEPNYLTSDEATAAWATNDGQAGRAWQVWALAVDRQP